MSPTRRQVLTTAKALAAGSLLAGCTARSQPEESTIDPGTVSDGEVVTPQSVTDAQVRQLVQGNTDFGFDLLEAVSQSESQGNLFCSPYSVSIALAMTYAGARAKTREQMARTLRFSLSRTRLHPAFYRIRQQVTEETSPETETGTSNRSTSDSETEKVPFQLTGANTLWGQQGFPWSDAYLRTLQANYGAGLHTVDFETHAKRARRRINDWVANRTEGKITNLIPKGVLGAMTRLVLTNAIYFRANWASTFDESATEPRPFTALDGSTTPVPMMKQTHGFPYASVDGHQLVELPYAGGDVSMVVLLPAKGRFESFQTSLTADRLQSLLGNLEEKPVTVQLPRFGFRTKLSLKRTLSDLGMPVAFDPRNADFSGMVADEQSSLHIGDVLHQSYIDVDEQGTEAAAATAVEMETTALVTGEATVTVDRPFLFLIRERETGSVVFLGRVTDAGAAQTGGKE